MTATTTAQPAFITDQDVLTVIAADTANANAVDAAFTAAGSAVPASTLAAWKVELAQYQAWATAATARLQGGFFGGEWFGVPDDYATAVHWGQTIANYAAIAQSLNGGTPVPLQATPAPSTPIAGTPGGGLDTSTKLLIGLVAGAAGLWALKGILR